MDFDPPFVMFNKSMNFIRRLNSDFYFYFQTRVVSFGIFIRGMEIMKIYKMSVQYLLTYDSSAIRTLGHEV